jgi:hypothetical protein
MCLLTPEGKPFLMLGIIEQLQREGRLTCQR